MLTIGNPNETRQRKDNTNPNTNTLLILSTAEVPLIHNKAKNDVKNNEPTAGDALIDDTDTKLPPSDMYATMIAVNRKQNKNAVKISPGIPKEVRAIERKLPSFFSDDVDVDVELANQLASSVTSDDTYVNIQHRHSPNMDGMKPASTVSAGRAIIPAPTADGDEIEVMRYIKLIRKWCIIYMKKKTILPVPANSREAPKTSSSLSCFAMFISLYGLLLLQFIA